MGHNGLDPVCLPFLGPSGPRRGGHHPVQPGPCQGAGSLQVGFILARVHGVFLALAVEGAARGAGQGGACLQHLNQAVVYAAFPFFLDDGEHRPRCPRGGDFGQLLPVPGLGVGFPDVGGIGIVLDPVEIFSQVLDVHGRDRARLGRAYRHDIGPETSPEGLARGDLFAPLVALSFKCIRDRRIIIKDYFSSRHEKRPKPIQGLDGIYSLKRLSENIA